MAKQTAEFKCPFCREVIPNEKLQRLTMLVEIAGGHGALVVCRDCGNDYNRMVEIATDKRIASMKAKLTGMTPELILSIRDESRQIQEEDERLVDEIVDVMDAEKAKKVFKKKGDMHEEAKSPIQVMQEQHAKGMRKAREKRIWSSGSGN